jgi:hypothetical protein
VGGGARGETPKIPSNFIFQKNFMFNLSLGAIILCIIFVGARHQKSLPFYFTNLFYEFIYILFI